MKRHVQEPGIRKWSGDDLLELQGEPLSVLDQFFGQYGDMVIKGCEIDQEAGTVSAGLVGINGRDVDGKGTYKVCPFGGATGVKVFPVFLALKFTELTREYDDTVVRPIAYRYEAELLAVKPTDRPCLELSMDGHRFLDAIQDESHMFVLGSERIAWDKKAEANHSHPVANDERSGFLGVGDYKKIQGQAALNTGFSTSINRLDDKVRVPTLSDEPTDDTLTYLYEEKARTFSIGQQCRVYDTRNQQYVFYQLYDITAEGKADWRLVGSRGNILLTENAIINLSSNQAQPDTALMGTVVRVIYGDADIPLAWQGEPLSVEIPVNMPYRIRFSRIEGFATPPEASFIAESGNTRQITAIYNTTILTVDIASNQADKADLDNLRITISGSVSGEITYKGQPLSLRVPLGEQVVITPAQVTGYAAVPPVARTPAAAVDTVTFHYNTTILTIDIASNQADKADLDNLRITISGSVSREITYKGQPLSLRVPTGQKVVITPSQVNGYSAVTAITRTPGTPTDSVTLTYNTAILTINIVSNQVDTSDLNNLQIVVTGSVNKALTYTGQPLSLKAPIGEDIIITPAQLDGYATISPMTKTLNLIVDAVTLAYNTTVTSISLVSNQGIDPSLNGVGITVKYGSVTKNLIWQGGSLSVRIPTGSVFSVSSGSIPGYNTPAQKTQTASGGNGSVSLSYTTERVTINVSADDGGSVANGTLTVTNTANGATIHSGKAGMGIVLRIPFQTSYKVAVNDLAMYITPSSQTFTANSATRNVAAQYNRIPESGIVFDKSISDPANITGDVNSGLIATILSKFRRCLCKKITDAQVAICYLDDSDSSYYTNGLIAALDGSEGDVMVDFPEFYYKHEKIDDNKFRYRFAEYDIDGTFKHVPRSLVGAYKAFLVGGKLYSRSGVEPSVNVGSSNFSTSAKARGTGYQLIDFQQHCVIAFMLYAKYGTRDLQAVLGMGLRKFYITTGTTNQKGNRDTLMETSGYVNGLAIEGVFGGLAEWIQGASVKDCVWTIIDPDGTQRNFNAFSLESGGWIKRVKAEDGPFFDMIPSDRGGSQTTYYSDHFWQTRDGVCPVLRSWVSEESGGASFLYAGYPGDQYISSRLAFRGIIKEESASVFKVLAVN